jgi:hypothetical protein
MIAVNHAIKLSMVALSFTFKVRESCDQTKEACLQRIPDRTPEHPACMEPIKV